VSSFELLLQNWDKKYSAGEADAISVGMDGHIDMGRGINSPKLITCRVESVKYESTPVSHFVRVGGRCWGEKLFRKVVTETYEGKKGEEIVKNLMDNYAGLNHSRSGTELVEETSTTYTKLEYENTPLMDILAFIAESSDKDGAIGYDFRVAPDGKFEFFPSNSKISSVNLGEQVEISEYSKDIFRVRNRIWVYGAADKSVPSGKDAWTESLEPADGAWSAVSGEISLDTVTKIRGLGSIKTYALNLYYAACEFTLDSGKEVNVDIFPVLEFWIARESAFNGNARVTLYDNASPSKSATYYFDVNKDDWFHQQIKCGFEDRDGWDVAEGFDWTQVKKVRFDLDFDSTGTGCFWVDGLCFTGRRHNSMQEDVDSQTAYGQRELVEVDEELHSDAECEYKAKALLAYLKDPAEHLTLRSTVLDYGNNPILPGDRISVTLPNENVNSEFRILTVEYCFEAKTQTLEITLELGREALLLADYVYALKSKTDHLSRHKIARA
jgi:hypothetical protein